MSEDGTKKGFQFVDRRRFNALGDERAVEPEKIIVFGGKATPDLSGEQLPRAAQGDALKGSRGESASEPTADGATGEGGDSAEEVTFTSFVMSLATQTMVQLGEMEPPPGMEIPIDVDAAHHTIEIVAMLQKKTKGNLSADEARFVTEVLHTLRMTYVRKAK